MKHYLLAPFIDIVLIPIPVKLKQELKSSDFWVELPITSWSNLQKSFFTDVQLQETHNYYYNQPIYN